MSPGNPSISIHNLRAYINRLREKIEMDPALPRVILTHHRQGYSFAGKEEARWFPELEPSSSGLTWELGVSVLAIAKR